MNEYLMVVAGFLPELNHYLSGFLKSTCGFDLCMTGIVIFIFCRGVIRGFSGELSRVLGLVIAVAAGLLCLRIFDDLVKFMERWINNIFPARVILILLIVVGCCFLWFLMENICARCLKITVNNRWDIFLGALLGLIKSVAVVLTICCVLYLQPNRGSVVRLEERSLVFNFAKPVIERFMRR